jgi:hypothetical protein
MLLLGMVVEFKAIFAGLKVQLPEAHFRAMVSVKLLTTEEREIVKVVVVVPMVRDCVSVEELRLKLAFPVPVKPTVDEPLDTLSVTTRLPLRTPVLVGVKVIWKAQVAFTAIVKGVAGHVVVSAKSPVVVMLVTVKGVWPLLVMYTVCAGLVTFIVSAGKTKEVGVNCTDPIPVTPVPVSETTCGLPVALS